MIPDDTGRLPGCRCGLTGPAAAAKVAERHTDCPHHGRRRWWRLWCLVVGHRRIRTITGVRLDEITWLGLAGTITGQRFDCTRCGARNLPRTW